MELRPRRLREAAALWASLTEQRGIVGRDAIWAHPDLLPTAADLDDAAGFSARRSAEDASEADVDAALAKLLDGGFETNDDNNEPDGPAQQEPDTDK